LLGFFLTSTLFRTAALYVPEKLTHIILSKM
jgi:hypothetical protein